MAKTPENDGRERPPKTSLKKPLAIAGTLTAASVLGIGYGISRMGNETDSIHPADTQTTGSANCSRATTPVVPPRRPDIAQRIIRPEPTATAPEATKPGIFKKTAPTDLTPEQILAGTIEIRLPVSQLEDTFCFNANRDIYYNPADKTATEKSDEAHYQELRRDGVLHVKGIRLTLVPDAKAGPFLNKIFGGKTFLIGHEDPEVGAYTNMAMEVLQPVLGYSFSIADFIASGKKTSYSTLKQDWREDMMYALKEMNVDIASIKIKNQEDGSDEQFEGFLKTLSQGNTARTSVYQQYGALVQKLDALWNQPLVAEPADNQLIGANPSELGVIDISDNPFQLSLLRQIADSYSLMADMATTLSYPPVQAQPAIRGR